MLNKKQKKKINLPQAELRKISHRMSKRLEANYPIDFSDDSKASFANFFLLVLFACFLHGSLTQASAIGRLHNAGLPSTDLLFQEYLNSAKRKTVLCWVNNIVRENSLLLKKRRIQHLHHDVAVDFVEFSVSTKAKKRDRYIHKTRRAKGTSYCYKFLAASIEIDGCWRAVVILPVKRGMETLDALKRLVSILRKKGIKIGCLLLDRGFYSVKIINWLKSSGISFLMPVRKTDPMELQLDDAKTKYTFKDGFISSVDEKATFTLAIIRKNKQKYGFATNLPIRNWRDVKALGKRYRRRWGIENLFKQVKGDFCIKTCSRNNAVRILLVLTAFFLYNSVRLEKEECFPCNGSVSNKTFIWAMFFNIFISTLLTSIPPP